MEKVKVGIIGAGGIVQIAYLPAYQKMEEAEVVAIVQHPQSLSSL